MVTTFTELIDESVGHSTRLCYWRVFCFTTFLISALQNIIKMVAHAL